MNLPDAVATWWVRNAEIRHGHIPAIGKVSAGTQQSTGDWKKWLLPLLLAAGTGAGVAALPWLTGSDETQQVETQPAEQSGSLYQYLEDNGLHLPE